MGISSPGPTLILTGFSLAMRRRAEGEGRNPRLVTVGRLGGPDRRADRQSGKDDGADQSGGDPGEAM